MVQSELVTTIIVEMTADEARQCIFDINSYMNGTRARLLDLRDRKGWKALGYPSWRECVVAEFPASQATLYRQLEAAEIEQRISHNENFRQIPETQLRPLSQLTPIDQPAAWQRAVETAPNGKVTAAHVEQVVREWNAPAVPVAPPIVSDKEVISVIKHGAQQAIDHAKSQWIGNVYQTDDATRRENIERWNTIEQKVADVVSPAKLAPLMSSATPEWYTPGHIINRVIKVFGQIDLDPCSNSKTEPNVPAKAHFTQSDDGIGQRWDTHGYITPGTPRTRVYMNPPYGDVIGVWVERLIRAYEDREIAAAIALLPARTDTAWFQPLYDYSYCFLRGRLKFSGAENSAPFPSVLVYLGNDIDVFQDAFEELGPICTRRLRG